MDLIFKALSDPGRRALLDALVKRDGQTTAELCDVLKITRFGTMKHLGILEEANLIVTKKVGRYRYHYLNTVPIQEIADRWISRYAQPWVLAIADLKQSIHRSTTMTATATRPQHMFQTYIRTTPEKLWQALTSPDMTAHYYFGTLVKSDWKTGSSIMYDTPDGQHMIEGKVLEATPPKKLVHTFAARWRDASKDDAPTRVTYEIEAIGDVCKLTLTHDDFEGETNTYHGVNKGWPKILSSLKSLLETGKPLPAGM